MVPLPHEYHDAMAVFGFVKLDWLSLILPATCLGDFRKRLIIVCTVPLLLLMILLLAGVALQTCSSAAVTTHKPLLSGLRSAASVGLLRSLPYVLFGCFAFAPSVSSHVFSAFGCDRYGYDDTPPATNRWYLHADLSVRCSDLTYHSAEHDSIKETAIAFIVMWPVGTSLLFAGLLARAWAAPHLREMSSAIAFLRSEYTDACSFWEILELTRKLILSGFLLLLPPELGYARIVVGVLVSISYLVLLLTARPFKSASTAMVATVINFTLCLTLFAALIVKTIDFEIKVANTAAIPAGTSLSFASGHSSAAFGGSAFSLTLVILAANFGVLLLALVFLGRHAYADARVPVLRLASTGQRPKLSLASDHNWAMFLSHEWGNQDVDVLEARTLNPRSHLFALIFLCVRVHRLLPPSSASCSCCCLQYVSSSVSVAPFARGNLCALDGLTPTPQPDRHDHPRGRWDLFHAQTWMTSVASPTLRSMCEVRR